MSGISQGWQAIPKAIRDLLASLMILVPALKSFCRAIANTCHNCGKGRDRRGACITLSEVVLKRADPLIYSQYYLMKMGLSVTWDNPDIEIFRGGLHVAPSELLPASDNDVRVRV